MTSELFLVLPEPFQYNAVVVLLPLLMMIVELVYVDFCNCCDFSLLLVMGCILGTLATTVSFQVGCFSCRRLVNFCWLEVM